MCILIGTSVMPVNFILKFIPDSIWPKLGNETEEDVISAKNDYLNLRKIREFSHSNR